MNPAVALSDSCADANRHFPARRDGVALVIVLSFLVLIVGVVLAFFSTSLLQQQISKSSASDTAVELFARGALNTTLGDLQQEIVAGSGSPTTAGTSPNVTTIYTPLAAVNVVPYLVGTSGAAGTENLLKISASGAAFYPTDTQPRASSSVTTTNSANGRSVSLARWNKPLLLTKANSSSTTDMTPVTAFAAPNWILVDNSGKNPTTWSSSMITSSSTANTTAVVGRYAYTIYDEGGLLDANVAGYPASVSATVSTVPTYSYRNAESFADLTQLGRNSTTGQGYLTQDQVNALVGWRDNASMSATGSLPGYTMDYSAAGLQNYFNFITGNATGFLTTANTALSASSASDHLFASRQQLINFFTNGVATSTTLANVQNALQYLGTFTRGVNAPTYTPPKIGSTNRPAIGTNNTAGSSYPAYGLDDQFNPSLINTRVTTTFTRYSDGTAAQVGEPLIKYRFPLSRLTLIVNAPSKVTNTNDIYKYFGLIRSASTSPWVYKHSTTSDKILKLSEVAAQGREPDFFELLQAGISAGSLGATLNMNFYAPNGNSYTDNAYADNNLYSQILQIGVNLIDQYDPDSYPTQITFGSSTDPILSGVESLPYISRVFDYGYTYQRTAAPNTEFGFFYIPEIWNPNTVATTTSSSPTLLRFIYAPNIITSLSQYGSLPSGSGVTFYEATTPIPAPPAQPVLTPIPGTLTISQGIQFHPTDASGFYTPTLLSSTTAGFSAPAANDTAENNFLGCCVGQLILTTGLPTTTPGVIMYKAAVVEANSSIFDSSHEISFYLQYQNSAGTWVTYDQMRNIASDITTGYGSFTGGMGYFCGRPDPESDRFGVLAGIATNATVTSVPPFRSDSTAGQMMHVGLGSNSTYPLNWNLEGVVYSASTGQVGSYPGCLSENLDQSQDTCTIDPDGLIRPAAGAYSSGINGNVSNGGYPMATDGLNNPRSRPIILNRPFRSVAEMGYANRGAPWKTLDFYSAKSGDAALLDLFTASPSPLQLMTAGQLDLNTRQSSVLQAMIAGAIKEEASQTFGGYSSVTASGVSQNDSAAADANALAKALVTLSTTGAPLQNRSELVTRYCPIFNTANYPNTIASSPDADIIRRREAALRALADVGNTRTWNLLIDVIAQTGRYTGNASRIDQFNVEGERRYWLHVAIDRYTGKVVSQSLETVNE